MRRLILICTALLLVMGCTTRVPFTTIDIKDPIRHYYPILRGQDLTVIVRINNTGKYPLVIKDIQPSCGCIILESDHEMVVPPERFMYVSLNGRRLFSALCGF